MTGLMTRIKAGPIPRQNPLTPSFFKMACTASIADSLTLRTVGSPSTGVPVCSTSFASVPVFGTTTACAACAVCTVQIGLVVSVVIDPVIRPAQTLYSLVSAPAMRPARIPSAVVNACGVVAVFARRRSSTDRASSSERQYATGRGWGNTHRSRNTPRWSRRYPGDYSRDPSTNPTGLRSSMSS